MTSPTPRESLGKTLRVLCVLGASAVSSLLAAIPPPRRRGRKGRAEKKISDNLKLLGCLGTTTKAYPKIPGTVKSCERNSKLWH